MLRSWFTKFAGSIIVATALIGAAAPAMAAADNQGGQQGKPLLFRAVVHEIVDETGLDRCEVLADLAAGQTFSQITQANGSTSQKVSDAVLAKLKERLDKAVANKKITQTKADEIYKNTSERLAKLMEADLHEQISKLYQHVCGKK